MPKDGYVGNLVERADDQITDAIQAVDSAGRIHGVEPEDVAASINDINRAITLRNLLKQGYDQS